MLRSKFISGLLRENYEISLRKLRNFTNSSPNRAIVSETGSKCSPDDNIDQILEG